MKVWDGHFAGLSTITRTGKTSLEPKDDKMQLTANIGIDNANARYSARYTQDYLQFENKNNVYYCYLKY